MAVSGILGADGRPARKPDLRREAARPSLAGIRQPWMLDAIAPSLTPSGLCAVLAAADSGQTRDFITLAGELEERLPRYGSCLGVRTRAVLGIEAAIALPRGANSAADRKLAEELEDVILGNPEVGGAALGCLDGLGKGWSPVEILWSKGGRRWTPEKFSWRDQRWFRWSREDPHELRLLDEADAAAGVPLERGKWLVHVPRLRAGIPARGGLARQVAALYCLAAWALADWMGFLETFGQPTRIGKYHSSASEDDRRALLNAVSGLGSQAAGTIPDSMSVELVQAASSSGTDAYERALRWLEEQVTIAVLGQSATTQGTPGRLGSDEAQSDVRFDILKADCADLAATLTRDLIVPYVDFNHGRRDAYPRVSIAPKDPEDSMALARTVAMLVPLGLRVDKRALGERLGLPEPENDELALAPAAPRSLARHVAAREEPPEIDLQRWTGEIAGWLESGWERSMEPLRAALGPALERAGGIEAGLAEGDAGPIGELAEDLAAASIAARAAGYGRD